MLTDDIRTLTDTELEAAIEEAADDADTTDGLWDEYGAEYGDRMAEAHDDLRQLEEEQQRRTNRPRK